MTGLYQTSKLMKWFLSGNTSLLNFGSKLAGKKTCLELTISKRGRIIFTYRPPNVNKT